MKKKIVNPHWINNARTVLSAEFHYDDGRKMQATITNIDAGNPDWDQIKAQFTMEEIEQNTLRAMKEQARKNAERKAREEADKIRKQNEILFDAKLQAFEIDAIKNSTDRKTKARIRRAKSLIEIHAFASKIITDAAAAEDAAAAAPTTE